MKKLDSIVLLVVLFILLGAMPLYAENGNSNGQTKPIEVVIKTKEDITPLNLDLVSALKLAQSNNLNIAIKKDQVNQSKLKIEEIKSQRLFLFFKFVNFSALEESASYSYKAAMSDLQATTNDVLEQTATKYYNVLQTLLAQSIAQEFLKKGELSLKQNTEMYNSGATTKFEVNQTEVFVSSLSQKLLESEIAYMVSSVDLAQYLNIEGLNIKIIPEEVNKINIDQEINIKSLNIIPENILLGDCISYSLKNRPEIKSLEYQKSSINELKKTTKADDVKFETLNSQINQLDNSLSLTKNTIKTTVTQSVLKFIGAKNQSEVLKQKYQLSKKALEQATVMRSEGMITNKDILNAQVDLAQSKNDYIKAIVNFNISQVNLLKELGLINISTIENNKPVDLLSSPETKEVDKDSKK